MIHISSKNSNSDLTHVQPDDVQPNAVDLRVDKIYRMTGTFRIGEENGKEIKEHRQIFEVHPDNEGYFRLGPGTYQIIMENIIKVGEDEAGWVITRSTLNRNGCFITSGLYDSGYHGVMAGALHVRDYAEIKRGSRVGQFLLFKAQSLKMYDGDYGLGKLHDQKYS